MVREALEAMRAFQSRRPPRSACTGTGCCSTPGRSIDFRCRGGRRGHRALRADDRRPRARECRCPAAGCASRRRRARPRAAHLQARPAAASPSSSATRRREPLQPLDEGAQRIISARRRGIVHPAEIVKLLAPRARDAAIRRRVRRARPRRRRRARPGRPPARRPTRASIVVGLVRNPTERYPEGMPRVVAARRPDARARLARRAGVPRASSPRSTSPSSSACRSSGSRSPPARKIAMDCGTENMDWIARGAAADRRASPRPAARSTSSSPASTSAPSRTGTPRRRCSCTPRASSS